MAAQSMQVRRGAIFRPCSAGRLGETRLLPSRGEPVEETAIRHEELAADVREHSSFSARAPASPSQQLGKAESAKDSCTGPLGKTP